jgi:hypothetical protein
MAQRWKRLSWRRRSIGVVAALALLAIVPIQMATGQTTEPVPFDAGVVRLHMNTDASYFRYEPLSGEDATQPFSASTTKCIYQPGSAGQSLIAVSAPIPPNTTKSVVGYQQKDNGYGLGVNTSGREGSGGCNQTNLNETLVLELQNDGATSPVKGLYVDYADLDVEFKFNATLNVEYFKDGGSLGSLSYNCTGSDCGPDSGGGDNYRVHLTAPGGAVFDKIVLTASSSNSQAAITLEGGNDAGTSDSLFHVVQLLDPVDCGDTIPGAGGGTSVNITLVNTADCSTKGYALDVTAREIEFITGGGATGQWVVDVDAWSPETAVNPVPVSRVFPPDPNGELVVWCDGTYDKDDLPSEGGTYGASMPGEPGEHFWCLIRQDTAIAGDGLMQVNETLLLEADARITRG